MVDGDTPSRGEVGESAFVLAAGVGYVRGWADAERAAEMLRAELRG